MYQSPELHVISKILGVSLDPTCSLCKGDDVSRLGTIDWNRFVSLVHHHRVGGLLSHWIKELELESSLPRRVWRALCDISDSIAAAWDDHRDILKGILMKCNESGIEVILLKGGQLGHTDYPHFSLRPIEDIDILVRKSDRSETIKLMLERGLNLYGTNQTCDKFFMSRSSRDRKERVRKPVFFEVHSNLQTPIRLNRAFNIDMDELWKGVQEKDIDGFPFLQLSPLDNLLYLGAHFGHHDFSRLIWGYDIALLIRRHGGEIDWEKLDDICRSMSIRGSLYYSLRLCQQLFPLPMRKKVLKNLSPSWWRGKVGHFLISKGLLSPEPSRNNRFIRTLIRLFLIDSWPKAILWFLFPQKEWLKKRYALERTGEIYTYYLIHPIIHVIRGILASWRT